MTILSYFYQFYCPPIFFFFIILPPFVASKCYFSYFYKLYWPLYVFCSPLSPFFLPILLPTKCNLFSFFFLLILLVSKCHFFLPIQMHFPSNFTNLLTNRSLFSFSFFLLATKCILLNVFFNPLYWPPRFFP